MSTAYDLARRLANIERRLNTRTAQASRTSIEGGALTVNDADGTPVLSIGSQEDGTYAVAAMNGGQVVANTLDLPAGSITETDIAEDSISTPKLRANAITADKIAAGAITADRLAVGMVGGELIADGSFESADMCAARLAGTAGAAQPPTGSWDFVSGGAYHGARAAVVYPGPTPGNKKLYLTPEVPAVPGDVYTGSVAVLAAGSPGGACALGLRVTALDGSTSFLPLGVAPSASAATTWTVFTGRATIPANAATVAAYIETNAHTATGTWSVDAVSVRRVLPGVEIADGAITADKIAATAITGKTITGGRFRTASAGEYLEIGEDAYFNGHAAIRWQTGAGDWTEPHILGAENITGGTPGRHDLVLSGGSAGGRSAKVTLSDWRPFAEVFTQDQAAGKDASVMVSPDGGVEISGHDGGRLRVDGRDVGRGKVASVHSVANSPALFAETAVLSIAGLTFRAGRAYRVRTGGTFTMTAAGVVLARLRDRTSSFTVEWGNLGHFPASQAGSPFDLTKVVYLRRTAASDLTGQTLALTLQASVAGTLHTATATSPRYLEVEDCGEAADYPHAVTV